MSFPPTIYPHTSNRPIARPTSANQPIPHLAGNLAPTSAKGRTGAFPPTSHKPISLVLISDTHNSNPLSSGVFHLPPGDILLHAGDLTNQGSLSELSRTLTWLSSTPYQRIIFISSNHDGVVLDTAFYAQHGKNFKFPCPQSRDKALSLIKSFEPKLVYLEHETKDIALGDGRRLRIFGSPWTPREGDANWGFQYAPDSEEACERWRDIPEDVDVVMTHGPMRYHLDANGTTVERGCEALRKRMAEVRPRLFVSGHVHEGYGVEILGWGEAGKEARKAEDPTRERRKKSWIVMEESGKTVVVNAALKAKKDWNKPVVVELMMESAAQFEDSKI